MKKRLTKSADDIVLTGALGGIAEYFGIDATIVRVIFAIAAFSSVGSLIPIYILLAILLPDGKSNPTRKNHKSTRKQAEKIDDDEWSDF